MNAKEKQVLRDHVNAVSSARDWCEDAKNDAEEKFEGHSDKWKESEAGEAMQEQIDALDELYDSLSTSADELDRILNS